MRLRATGLLGPSPGPSFDLLGHCLVPRLVLLTELGPAGTHQLLYVPWTCPRVLRPDPRPPLEPECREGGVAPLDSGGGGRLTLGQGRAPGVRLRGPGMNSRGWGGPKVLQKECLVLPLLLLRVGRGTRKLQTRDAGRCRHLRQGGLNSRGREPIPGWDSSACLSALLRLLRARMGLLTGRASCTWANGCLAGSCGAWRQQSRATAPRRSNQRFDPAPRRGGAAARPAR